MRRTAAVLAIAMLLAFAGTDARAQAPVRPSVDATICGSLENGFGPFDYRTMKSGDRAVVERFHFTPQVESLLRGESGTIIGDLDYTLRAIPNHYRALAALTRLAHRQGGDRIKTSRWPTECYFERAMRFVPDDARVHASYGAYLFGVGRKKEALAASEYASRLDPVDPMIAYNLGLMLLDSGDDDRALEQARKAYAGGVSLPGLRTRLEAKGKRL